VVYLVKARTVEPEEEPLLANGSKTILVSRQRLGKHGNGYACNNRGTVINGVFYSVRARGL
jgi:hypothetical protein